MKIQNLKEDDLMNILGIYCELVGDSAAKYFKDRPGYTKSKLALIRSMNGSCSLKLGSKWSIQSELRFAREGPDFSSIKVIFNPNIDSDLLDRKWYHEVFCAKKEFEQKVRKYLSQKDNRDKIAPLAAAMAAIIFMVSGVIVLNTNITGNAISNANPLVSDLFGAICFVSSLILGYLYLRPRS
jgi:hypothetical protein